MYVSLYKAIIFTTSAIACVSAKKSKTTKSATSTRSLLAVESPTFLPEFDTPSGVDTSYLSKPINTSDTLSTETLNLKDYPEPWESPSTKSKEVKAAYKAINWKKVPKAPTRTVDKNGDLVLSTDDKKDSYCWWSNSNCVSPKVNYLPEDIYYCPRAGDWGLNFDDGPYNHSDDDEELDAYAEPKLYNFLAEHNEQKATLFYIGSNVATYPAAARRALNDGHVICVHTWSHPQMTTKTNIEVVAELYWTLRAIKEATGITPKCWRPPYGDVDDRVRAIAWQMGMRTIIWDRDTNDWNMPGDGGGNLSPSTVEGYFEDWVDGRKNGSDASQGHIVLEHELNNSTVTMAEKWIPTLQETFNLVSIHQCMNISQPYWEDQWVYPTENSTSTTTNNVVSTSSTSIEASVTEGSSEESSEDVDKTTTSGASSPLATEILLHNLVAKTSGASQTSSSSLAFIVMMLACICLF